MTQRTAESRHVPVDIQPVVVRTEPVQDTVVELVVDTAVIVVADAVENQKVLVLQLEQEQDTGLVLVERR